MSNTDLIHNSKLIKEEEIKEKIKEEIKAPIAQKKLDVRYTYIVIYHFISTILFSFIYYYLMLDFDTYWFAPAGYTKKYWLDNKLLTSFYISLNFETGVAYVDIKCKDQISRSIIMIQIAASYLITFYILLNY